jgi:hypothetical protein
VSFYLFYFAIASCVVHCEKKVLVEYCSAGCVLNVCCSLFGFVQFERRVQIVLRCWIRLLF